MSSKKPVIIVGILLVALASAVAWMASRRDAGATEGRFALGGKVKRLSGDHLKLKDGRYVEFAGIRLPYGDEPHSEKSRRVLNKWIEDEGVRLQFDEVRDYKDDRILAYVYANDTFINERLVREGLAFVKLRAGNRRHAETLLAAQSAARDERKGIWEVLTPTAQGEILGDAASATLHRSGCPELKDKTGLVKLAGTADGFDRGMAPCGKCQPCSNAGDGPAQ